MPVSALRHPALRVVLALGASTAMLASSARPVVTLLNDALELRWRAGHAFGAAAALLAWLLVAIPRDGSRALRVLACVLALACGVTALARATFRVRVDEVGVLARGLLGSTLVAWRDVTRVEQGSAQLVVWGRDERQVRVPVAHWRDDQRAALERAPRARGGRDARSALSRARAQAPNWRR